MLLLLICVTGDSYCHVNYWHNRYNYIYYFDNSETDVIIKTTMPIEGLLIGRRPMNS